MIDGNFTHASLFSGIGGFDLAAEWAGWKNVFHCEINPFGQKVLKYHFPNAISYADITKTDFTDWKGKIDILTGGFPCQPFSLAGRRKGSEDDRYLWPQMLRAIREIRPAWIVGENVGGIITMVQPGQTVEVGCQASLFSEDYKDKELRQQYVVETVCSDLERQGYSVQPLLIPACAVGAPHRRDRVWFVAHRSDARIETVQSAGENRVRSTEASANTKRCRSDEVEYKIQPEQSDGKGIDITGRERIASYTDINGCRNGENKQEPITWRKGTPDNSNGGTYWASTDPEIKQSERPRFIKPCIGEQEQRGSGRGDKQGTARKIPNWDNFPTQSPVCSRYDGVFPRLDGITFSNWRKESVKAYGNAIVPQVAYEIFKAINQVRRNK